MLQGCKTPVTNQSTSKVIEPRSRSVSIAAILTQGAFHGSSLSEDHISSRHPDTISHSVTLSPTWASQVFVKLRFHIHGIRYVEWMQMRGVGFCSHFVTVHQTSWLTLRHPHLPSHQAVLGPVHLPHSCSDILKRHSVFTWLRYSCHIHAHHTWGSQNTRLT